MRFYDLIVYILSFTGLVEKFTGTEGVCLTAEGSFSVRSRLQESFLQHFFSFGGSVFVTGSMVFFKLN